MRGENAPVGQVALQSVWILTFCKPSEGGPHLTLLRCLHKKKEKKLCEHGIWEGRPEWEASGQASKHFPHSPEVLTSPQSEWWQRKEKLREQQQDFSSSHSHWGVQGAERRRGKPRRDMSRSSRWNGARNGSETGPEEPHIANVQALPKKRRRRKRRISII